MVLARKVENDKGMVLCKEGTELTAKILFRLENGKISHLTVQGHPVRVEGEGSLPEKIRELEHRFRKVESDPLMREIREIFREQLVHRFGEEEDPSANPEQET